MDKAHQSLISALHQSPFRCVIALTGGGASAAGMLLSVPGASRTILEVHVPYHEQSLAEFVGATPKQFVSIETSAAMAQRAFERAGWLMPAEPILGLGSTASLASDVPKRGDHRFHVTAQTADEIRTASVVLAKGARDREDEEAVVASVILNLLAECVGIDERVETHLRSDEPITVESVLTRDCVAQLVRGECDAVCVTIDGRFDLHAHKPDLIVSGAFNPVHDGHWGMATAASRLTGKAPAFELSVRNADKPPLRSNEVRRRLSQFAWRAPVWLTGVPTFVEKSRLFCGATFVVGVDTAERIMAPRYYGGGDRMHHALVEIGTNGCRFLVAGRLDPNGRFVELKDLSIPDPFRDLFAEIPCSEFQSGLSSTALRI